MIDDTLAQIERRLQQAGSLNENSRGELLNLLNRLKSEIAALSQSDPERAREIARRIESSTHEATRTDRTGHGIADAVENLSSSVAGFEEKHPKLVEIVNRISFTLSNMGI